MTMRSHRKYSKCERFFGHMKITSNDHFVVLSVLRLYVCPCPILLRDRRAADVDSSQG